VRIDTEDEAVSRDVRIDTDNVRDVRRVGQFQFII
jgi:hypothetical protein